MSDRNMWGTLKADVDTDSGYCADCERENGKHYTGCPTNVVYVNVNEEGEEYDRHDTLEAALAVQFQFPNDTVEVRTRC